MTNEQLKELEDKLWDSANAMRASGGIKASDYAVPVLGIIFLKFAENKYSQHEKLILDTYQKEKGTRAERTIQEIALATCGFYLPDNARYEHLLHLPEKKSLAKALKLAMEGIEEHQDAKFQDVLPKDAYFNIEKKKADILPQLLKDFSDIPADASGDVFGKIYEYFLGKFAMSEGQKGGEFFTPTSVVRFIVEVIEPYSGKIYDPACGSGGMFVQSANFIRKANHDLNDIYVCGQENTGETVRLAKMNLLVNNLRGEIREVNSYESDPYDSYGKFDYVMANPPFNVKSVKEGTVKNDKRFYTYGLPKNKGKKDDKITDANYLWVSLFATSLNAKGRAGFVMANSASDARNTEYEIRKKIVDSGIVDCMVSMPSNMFFTVTLPATLWFFDKGKVKTDRKDRILFIDARNVYYQIDRAHREWQESHQQNLAAIVRLHRGENARFLELVADYFGKAADAQAELTPAQEELQVELKRVLEQLKLQAEKGKTALTPAKKKKLEEADFFKRLASTVIASDAGTKQSLNSKEIASGKNPRNDEQHVAAAQLKAQVEAQEAAGQELKQAVTRLTELWQLADKNLKGKADKVWAEHLNRADKGLEALQNDYAQAAQAVKEWHGHIEWLQTRFPKGEYQDVVGLCKSATKEEYAEEQDYSLNAGRYVGVEIEADKITKPEFQFKLKGNFELFEDLSQQTVKIEEHIRENLTQLLDA
jgi:type I restriction enzyme M protein